LKNAINHYQVNNIATTLKSLASFHTFPFFTQIIQHRALNYLRST